MWKDSTSSTVLKLLLGIAYSVIASLVAAFAMKHFQLEDLYGGGEHDSTVRSLVVPITSTDVSLSRVGGLQNVKRELRQWVLLPMSHPDIFYSRDNVNVRPPRGVLLHGPPGTGKTMLVRAIAAESKATLISLHAAALENKWWGESPKILNAAFRMARTKLSPCIIFFDEIDGLGRSRTDSDQSCVYSLKCELLRNMDSLETKTGEGKVIVIACTNCPDSLDPALRRRFEKTLYVDKPDEKARFDILRKLCRGPGGSSLSVLKAVSNRTSGMTGADLARLHSEASMKRLSNTPIENKIVSGEITSGKELTKELGPLLLSHWEGTGLLGKGEGGGGGERGTKRKRVGSR